MRANVRTSLAAALTAAGLLSAAACGGGGGGGGGRPSTSEIAKALSGGDNSLLGTDTNLSKSAADCIAKALHDSKISDSGLRALVRQDKSYKPSASDTKAAASAAADMAKCAGAGN